MPSIGLPSESTIKSECHIAGWGKTEFHGQSPVILSATVDVMSKTYCNGILPGKRGKMYRKVTGVYSFCAGLEKGGNDSCQGDSGGPLYCKVGESYVLYGITSKGRKCGAEKQPGIYTKLANVISWIQQYTTGNYFI